MLDWSDFWRKTIRNCVLFCYGLYQSSSLQDSNAQIFVTVQEKPTPYNVIHFSCKLLYFPLQGFPKLTLLNQIFRKWENGGISLFLAAPQLQEGGHSTVVSKPARRRFRHEHVSSLRQNKGNLKLIINCYNQTLFNQFTKKKLLKQWPSSV